MAIRNTAVLALAAASLFIWGVGCTTCPTREVAAAARPGASALNRCAEMAPPPVGTAEQGRGAGVAPQATTRMSHEEAVGEMMVTVPQTELGRGGADSP